MFQNAASYNGYLTELCQAAYADEADSISRKLFPTVGVKTAVGSYKKRDIDNAFRVYKTALSRGNSPTRIDTNATDDFTTASPTHWRSAVGNSTWNKTEEETMSGKAIFRI